MDRRLSSLALAALLAPTASRADGSADRNWVFLADAQGSVAFARGYPNDVQKIGDPAFEVTSGALGGGTGTFAILASLHPRVAFGLWGSYGAALNATYTARSGGGGVRVELLPFAEGWAAPLGFQGSFGVGGATVGRHDGTGSDAGTVQSAVRVGAFRDTPFVEFEASRLTWGPTLDYTAIFSRDFAQQSVDVGVRLTWVTTPKKP